MNIFGNKLYLEDKLKTLSMYELHELLGAIDQIRGVIGDDYGCLNTITINNLTYKEIKDRRKEY